MSRHRAHLLLALPWTLATSAAAETPPAPPPASPAPAATPVAHGPASESELGLFWGAAPDQAPERRRQEANFVTSNERRHDLWQPVIQDKGGAYIGVGSDQALLFVAWQKPRFAWLIDYDPMVVDANRAYLALVAAAPTAEELLALLQPKARKKVRQILTAADPASAEAELEAWGFAAARFAGRLAHLRRGAKLSGVRSYLDDPAQYQFLRGMVAERRIRPMVGNLIGTQALKAIGDAARQLGVPVRVLYLSNAEEFFVYNQAFKSNVNALPFDEGSVILRTWPFVVEENLYYYNVQPAASFLAWLEHPPIRNIKNLIRHQLPRRRPPVEELTRIDGLPPGEHAPTGAKPPGPPTDPAPRPTGPQTP